METLLALGLAALQQGDRLVENVTRLMLAKQAMTDQAATLRQVMHG
jgi:hypothetical protein